MGQEIANLAAEIAAPYRPEHDSLGFRSRWVTYLAALVAQHCEHRGYAYPERIQVWVELIDNTPDVWLAQTLEQVRAEIEAIDSDDGWATDPAGAALEAVCLALMPKTRWLAESGQRVWFFVTGAKAHNAVSKFSKNAWLREVYRICAGELPPPTKQEQAA